MSNTTPTLQPPRLGKQKMAELMRKAKSLGMSPQRYVLQLIEEDLALDRKARTTTFAELMGPGREVDEQELDRLVDEARTRHHQQISKGKR
jgi:type II secretory pathway component PulL